MTTEQKKPEPIKLPRPARKGHIIITNRVLDRYAGGFMLALARLLPDAAIRQRVVAMYHESVKPLHVTLTEALTPLSVRETEAQLLSDDTEKLEELLAIRLETEALWNSEVEILAPRRPLAENDLPREVKGTIKGPTINGQPTVVNGKDNASDNGRIMDMLLPDFFVLDKKEEAGEKAPEEPKADQEEAP